MSDKQPIRRDFLGIALFAAGAFLTVVVAKCYWEGAAATDYAGVTLFDKELIRWLGRPACLVLGVVACALGARLFLGGPVAKLARSILVGGVCLALGTSILMGALNPEYGGVFGALIGSWASANLSKAVGIPLGLVCVFVPVWFAWLRPGDVQAGEKGVRELQPTTDRSTEASSGVTAEEALELIPRRPVAMPATSVTSKAPKVDAGAATGSPAARPIDPHTRTPAPAGAQPLETTDDPLQRTHPSQAPAVPERLAGGLPVLGVAAREDLADPAIAQEPAGKRPLALQPVDEFEEVGPAVPLTAAAAPAPSKAEVQPPQGVASAALPAPAAPAAPHTSPAAPRIDESFGEGLEQTEAALFDLERADPPSAVTDPVAMPLEPRPLARASWEQDDTGDDIPVDAYGTPLTLVEELRRDSTVRAASAKEEALEEAAREAGVDDEEQDQAVAGEESPRYEVAALAAVEVVEEDDDEANEEETLDEAAKSADRAPVAAAVPAAETDDLEADDDAELAETDDEAESVVAEDADDEDADEEDHDDDRERDTLAVEASDDDDTDDEEGEDARGDEDGDDASDDEDEALRREAPLFAAARPAKAETSTPVALPEAPEAADDEAGAESDDDEDAESLFDDDTDEDAEAEEADERLTPAAERDVVLTPQPAPEPTAQTRASEDDDEDAELGEAAEDAEDAEVAVPAPTAALAPELSEEDELVYKAGVLFLERQRVAVSMLQREFGLDFEQATHVLDRLQAAGLIGPYLGGQRRDILLTLDQWRSRAVAR